MRFGNLSIDANLYVFAIVGAFFIMAFVFGEGRLKRIATALLAGFFVTEQVSDLAQSSLRSQSIDPALLSLGILAIVTIGLSLGKAPSVGGRFGLRSFILAFLTSATLIGYTQSYLTRAESSEVLEKSYLVAMAANNKLWFLIAMTAWLVIITVWKRKVKDDDEKKGKKGRKKK